MNSVNHFKLEFLSTSENVGTARVTAAAFASQANFTLTDIDEIKVAVSEAVSNAIIHGYRNQSGMVTMTMILYENGLEITVSDSGQGIEDVELARQPSYSTDPERMGLGFVFMDSFMDKLNIQSKPGHGTTVTMFRNIHSDHIRQ